MIQQMRFFVFFSWTTIMDFCTVKRKLFIPTLMKQYLLILSLLLTAGLASAQGWERIYGGGGADAANSIASSRDGGYILTGYYGLNRLLLLKVDADGGLQWSNKFTAGSRVQGKSVVATRDSGYVVAGFVDGPTRDIYLLKTDAFGKKLWAKQFGSGQSGYDEEADQVIELPDGSLVITGVQKKPGDTRGNLILIKTDASGNQVYFKSIGNPQQSEEWGHSVCLAPNGDLLVTGEIQAAIGSVNKNLYLLRFNANGDTLWTRQINPSNLATNSTNVGYSIKATSDGGYLIAGYADGKGLVMRFDGSGSQTPVWTRFIPQADLRGIALAKNGDVLVGGEIEVNQGNAYVARLSYTDGSVLCEMNAGKSGFDGAYGIVATADGGAAIAGESFPFFSSFENRAYLVKVSANCKLFTSYVNGSIYWDKNSNCQRDTTEPGLRGWIAIIANQYDTTYVVTNGDGNFLVPQDLGSYTVSLYQPNTYWVSCTPTTIVNVPAQYDTVSVSIPVRSTFTCPRNEVDIATPVLRRCADNVYTVRYCNSGTIPSTNTKVEVIVDHALNVHASSVTYTQNQDTLTFDVGTLNNGDCGSFTFTAFLNCNSHLGETHCVKAHIKPDEFCDQGLWNGCHVVARATCDGDSVRMYLRNIGTGNTGPVGYVISEDIIMLVAPNNPDYSIPLNTGTGEVQVWTHAANDSTFRITAQQCPNYPGLSIPTAAIEGCIGQSNPDSVSFGYYTMFPEDDQDPFIASDCQETTESTYNPVYLKRGHPKGYDVIHHYVSPQTDLDYLIHFTYTGADTAKQVVVRDTLSPYLDPATVYPGASSHAYDFQVYGSGIVQFSIPNANLVAGSGATDGYVKFRVSQRPNLPCGTVINNTAAIYFDYNSPQITNQTFHTSCPDSLYLILGTHVYPEFNASLKVYPNPMDNGAWFELSGVEAHTYCLSLYDSQGRLLDNQFYSTPTFRLLRHQIPAGIIFYRLTADGKPVATGDLIVK
jgi:hypothetical protein